MSTQPLISVIMPVYNAGSFLRPAVESVLAQTHRNLELILIDDGSTDGCVAQIDDITDPRLRRMRQENAGKPVAMNRALATARGEYYALNDADDLSRPQRLERQLKCLQENPSLAGVFSGYTVVIGARELAPVFSAKSIDQCKDDIDAGRMPGHDPTAMYRMAKVSGISYTEDLPIVEGFDYILRVGEQYPLMVLGECLYGYRIHPNSVTKKDPARRNRLIQDLYDRMCDRRGLPRRIAPGLQGGRRSRWGNEDNGLASIFTTSVADQVLSGQRLGALKTGLACWQMHPLSGHYLKPFVYALTPRFLMKLYRGRKQELARRKASAGRVPVTQGKQAR